MFIYIIILHKLNKEQIMINSINNQSNPTLTIDDSKQFCHRRSSRIKYPSKAIQSNIPTYITPLKTSNQDSTTIICGEDPGLGCS